MQNSSTAQQVAKTHLEQISGEVVVVTPQTCGYFKALNLYEVNGITYKCLEVVTKGKGNHTLYRMQDTNTNEVISGDIADLKTFWGIDFVNNYKTAKNPFGKVFIALSKIANLVAECEDDEMTKAFTQLKGLAGIKDAEARAKEAEAEKARKEKESHDRKVAKFIADFMALTGKSEAEAKKALGL